MKQSTGKKAPLQIDIADNDIYEAMKDIQGYLDITPGDLKEIYHHAYMHALERIACSVRAVDLMTKRVHSVRKETLLRDVAEILAANVISGVPVLDEDMHVAGIISEKDFCSHMGDGHSKSLMGVIADCLRSQSCHAMTIGDKKAGDIMTSPVITVREHAVLSEITKLLTENNINRVPVVDEKGCIVGIISRGDIVRASLGNQIESSKAG